MKPAASPLPASLERRLRRLRQRWRVLRVVHGTGLFLLSAIALLSAGLLVDVLCPLPFSVRLCLLFGTCLGTIWACYRFLLAPLKTGISDAELASLVERAHPELQERLSSSVELFDESLPDGHRGSQRLRELLVKETLTRTGPLDFGKAVGFRSARIVLGWSCLSLSLLLLPLVDASSGYPLLMTRFFQPWSNLQRVALYEIEVRDGDRVAPRGSDVQIEVLVTTPGGHRTRPGELWCHWTTRSGTSDRRLLEPTDDGLAFTTTWPEVLEGFDFEISAGSSRSRKHRVDIVDPPRLVGITLDIQPPAYTGLPARTTDVVFGDVPVLSGSELTFRLVFNKPLDHGTLELTPVAQVTDGPGTRWDLELSDDGLTGRTSLVVSRGGPLTIGLADHDGLLHQDKTHRQLVLVEDRPPTLTLSGHDAPQAVRPGDLVEFRARATDDFGLAALQLLIEVDTEQGEPQRVSQDVDSNQLGGQELIEDFAIDLSKFDLHDGDTMTYRVRAADGRPQPGPNETWSQPRTLLIDLTAEPPGTTDVARRQAELKRLIEKARKDTATNRNTLEQIRQQALTDLKQQKEFQGDAAIRRAAADERELATRIDRLARRLDNLPLFRNIAPAAREVARKLLPAATERLEPAIQAPLADKATRLSHASQDVVRAEQKLEELSQQFDTLAELERDLLELGRLARQAGQLAEDVEQLARLAGDAVPDETPAEQEQRRGDFEQTKKALGNRQGQLAGQLDELMQRRPEIVEAARQDQLDLLEGLARQARELSEPQAGLAKALQRESVQAAKDLTAAAAAQAELNRKTEALARRSDAVAQRQATAPLDATAARQALTRLKQGDRQAAHGDQQRAAEELERLADALKRHAPLPVDPVEALRELSRRQTRLAESIGPAVEPPDSNQETTKRQQRQATEQLGLNAALASLPLPEAQRTLKQQAAKDGVRTAEELLASQPQTAAKSAVATARQLQELARSLEKSALTPQQLQQMKQLQQQQLSREAGRAKVLADQLARLQQQIQQLDPLKPDPAALQKAIAQQAQLEKQAQALPPSLQGLSRRATEQALQQARQALAQGETALAASQQARATAALRDLQQQVTALAKPPQDAPTATLVQQARQLAQQQRILAKQGQSQPATTKPQRPPLDESALGQQQQLAREATRLAIDVAGQTGTRSAASQESARFARQAAQAAQQALAGELDQAREQAEGAQTTGQQAARALEEATDPQPDPALGRRTQSLAERQARLAGEFRRMQQTALSRNQARQLAQESLATATKKLSEDLGEAVRRLEGRPLELPTPAGQARDARAATDQGQQAMDRSGENIARSNPSQAAASARQAARALKEASRLASGAVRANERPETPVPGQVGRQVAEASQELDRARAGLEDAKFSEKNSAQASRTGQPPRAASPQSGQKPGSSKGQPSGKQTGKKSSGQQAGQPTGQQTGQQPGKGKGSLSRSAQQLRRASESLARASQQLQPGQPGQAQPGDPQSAAPGESSPSSRDTAGNSGSGSSVAMELQRLEARLQRLSGRNWGRLPGKLRTEILQAARRDPNGDYARLIRFYFREIAREGREESRP